MPNAILFKPTARYEHRDWLRHNDTIAGTSHTETAVAHDVRQDTSKTVNDAEIKTKWDYHDNNVRLCDRIREVERWKQILEQTRDELDAEIDQMAAAKQACEDSLEAKHLLLETALETLTLREGRREVDVVRDDPETQLNKEVVMIEDAKKILQEKCNQALEQLCRLTEARQAVHMDITDKYQALDIDTLCLSMTPLSPNISFKPNPMRIPTATVSLQQWHDFSRLNKERADHEMLQSTKLREDIYVTIQQIDNDLASQRDLVDFNLRKRLHELEQTRDDLLWQKKKIEEEIEVLLSDIRKVEAAIRDKDPYRKLAETRLEYRMDRPNMELVYDPPWHGLREEVLSVKATQEILRAKLQQLYEALDRLRRHLQQVENDLIIKNNSITVEQRSIDTHSRVRKPEPAYKTESFLDKAVLLRPEHTICRTTTAFTPRPDIIPVNRNYQDCTYTQSCGGSSYQKTLEQKIFG